MPKSHPVRVRGLKHNQIFNLFFDYLVAPRAGAWIETFILLCLSSLISVAPRAGAWIETRS